LNFIMVQAVEETVQEMQPLPGNWAACVATVFEDAVDQLNILGSILPQQKSKSTTTYQVIADEITHILTEQKRVENEIEMFSDTQRIIKQLTTDLISQQSGINERGLDGQDNLLKINRDRQFAEDTLRLCLNEINHNGKFDSLVKSVDEELTRKGRFRAAQQSEAQARRDLRQLTRQLQLTRKEKEQEIHEMTEMIAHLKDQLQEMKAKTNLEGKYVKKSAENRLEMNSTLKGMEELSLKTELDQVRKDIEMENRAHTDVKNFLLKKRRFLEDKVEYWMEKYEKDTEAKSNELQGLKADKERDLKVLQELARTYDDYERVVVEDRTEKNRIREAQEREELELKTSIKIQAWWRGTMVRRGLGEFKRDKDKKKKGKGKGKKGKGKGKKGKK